ncbi:MAG: type II/IV secretion system protein [Opitutales bacterium]|nr:type II/IV secretion system protein [Opitutales bacterium]
MRHLSFLYWPLLPVQVSSSDRTENSISPEKAYWELSDWMEVFLESQKLNQAALTRMLASHFGMAYGEHMLARIDRKLISSLSAIEWQQHRTIPLRIIGDVLEVLIDHPENYDGVNKLSAETDKQVIPYLITPESLNKLLQEYAHPIPDTIKLEKAPTQQVQSELTHEALFQHWISEAIDLKATDIHIESGDESCDLRFRIFGKLETRHSITPDLGKQICGYILQKAKLDPAEPKKPQDGSFRVQISDQQIEIRVSSLVGLSVLSLALRLLPAEICGLGLDQLGLTDIQLQQCQNLLTLREGMVLLTGPTGSGKTTTLYAWLRELNDVSQKIITIENPVEMKIQGVNQISINPKAGLHFKDALKSVLRQAPDVILLGEIRDPDTAALAVSAALSGHFLLSTLHARSAFGSLDRLYDLGVDCYQLSMALRAVLSQRLISCLCPQCKKPAEHRNALLLSEIAAHHKGDGCPLCRYTGYSGQSAVFEIVLIDEILSAAIAQGITGNKLSALLSESGVESLGNMLKAKVGEGLLSVQEYLSLL